MSKFVFVPDGGRSDALRTNAEIKTDHNRLRVLPPNDVEAYVIDRQEEVAAKRPFFDLLNTCEYAIRRTMGLQGHFALIDISKTACEIPT